MKHDIHRDGLILAAALCVVGVAVGCARTERLQCEDEGDKASKTQTTQATMPRPTAPVASAPEKPSPDEERAEREEGDAGSVASRERAGADRFSTVGSAVERDRNLGLIHTDGGVIDTLANAASLGPAPGAGASAGAGRVVPPWRPFDAVPGGVDTTAPGGAAAGRRADGTYVGAGGYVGP